jgi:hypothetical protein
MYPGDPGDPGSDFSGVVVGRTLATATAIQDKGPASDEPMPGGSAVPLYNSATVVAASPLLPAANCISSCSSDQVAPGTAPLMLPLGTRVMGLTTGALASHVSCDFRTLVTLPPNINFEDGAAAPTVQVWYIDE